MQNQNIDTPERYLAYFHKELVNSGQLTPFPKLLAFYHNLTAQFTAICENKSERLFLTWRQLLAIDAQIQILVDLNRFGLSELLQERAMTEDEVIRMIQSDQKSYYRELVGTKMNDAPRWGLIYLSEE